jgi:DeoR/GlpR family transcriptional regulator of sugar metabolism
MILSELTGYMAQHRRVALLDMVYRFGASPDAVRSMLATLQRKGRVRRVEGGAACGTSCGKCDQSVLETYEWVGSPSSSDSDAHP